MGLNKTKPKINYITTILTVLVLLGLAGTGYMFWQNQKLKKDVKTSQTDKKSPDQLNDELVKKVGQYIVLPQNERPTILTVDDKEKLKDQAFFKPAENGDKILIYTQAKKAIIFRESWNKIIDVGPVSVTGDKAKTDGATTNQSSSTSAPSSESTPAPNP